MSSEALHHAVVELGWSLFTELGVPGVVRHHQGIVLDPEPIVAAAPSLFELDPRLRDQVYGWCASHAGRLSVSRLQGALRELPDDAQTAFHRFAATLREHARVKWPDDGALPWPRAPEVKARRLPLERPSLLRFRARALCGVGARADVLCELIARRSMWVRASDLAEQGYSKRAIAGILAELSEAGLARQVADGNALTFKLSRPEHLMGLLEAKDLGNPPWLRIMRAVRLFLELARLEESSAVVRRVEANKLRETLRRLADQLWLDTPPRTRGDPHAWEELMAWATRIAAELAAGTSPALGVRSVRAAAVEGGREVWVWLHRTAADHETLSETLREPRGADPGVACTTVSPSDDGWTSYRLVLEPGGDEAGARDRVERLVSPMKVAWRQVSIE